MGRIICLSVLDNNIFFLSFRYKILNLKHTLFLNTSFKNNGQEKNK